jgi:plastocyanin
VTPRAPARGRAVGRALAAAAAAVLAAAAPARPASTGGETRRIEMRDVAFAPAQATARVGDTVVWGNADIVAHTATSREGGFDVNVPPGGEGSAVMTRPGRFGYTCRYHPNMRGEVVVEP